MHLRGHRITRRTLLGGASLTIIVWAAPVVAAEVAFTVTELAHGEALAMGATGRALNRKATVVGIGMGDAGPAALRSRGKEMRPLPAEEQPSVAHAVNDDDVIVGSVGNRAARWADDELTLLPPFGDAFTTAYGINADGQIVGSADSGANSSQALLWNSDEVIELPSLGGPASRAVAISRDGTICGFSTLDEAGDQLRAVIWREGEIVELPTLGGEVSEALAINREDVIVGSSTRDGGFSAVDHATIWREGEPEQLESLGRVKIRGRSDRVKLDRSIATSINDVGDICGRSASASENGAISIATLWLDGKAINLNSMIGKANRDLVLTSADGINNDGELVCTGYLLEDETVQRVFRLQPE
jgi:probable HAF family extracellular repeat protein